MSETKTKPYKVKPGKLVIHGGEKFTEGMELQLADAVAEVHGANLEESAPSPEEPSQGDTDPPEEPKSKTRKPKPLTTEDAD